MSETIKIERKGENGFETVDLDMKEAITVLNNDIANEMTVWIDSKPFMGEILTLDDLLTCRKEISVTNRLVGG